MESVSKIKVGILTLAASMLLSVLGSSLNPAQATEQKESKPLWSIDLADIAGYREYMSGDAPVEHATAFNADNKIAVSFLARRRSSGGSLPLVCIVLDTDTRKVEKSLVWSTPYKDYNSGTWVLE